MKLSPFGEWVRAYRQIHEISLREMARNLGKTPSFLSAVELGRKPTPRDFHDAICTKYSLEPKEVHELKAALEYSVSRTEIRFKNDADSSEKEVALLFARNFDGISAEKKMRIKKILEDDDE